MTRMNAIRCSDLNASALKRTTCVSNHRQHRSCGESRLPGRWQDPEYDELFSLGSLVGSQENSRSWCPVLRLA